MRIAFLSRLSPFCDREKKAAGNHAAPQAFFFHIRLSDYTDDRAVILTISPSFRRVEIEEPGPLGSGV